MNVRPEWIDYNGHMNMAYYSVIFDEAADQIYPDLGFGPTYQKTGCTTYTGEFHIRYLRELHLNDRVTPMPQAILDRVRALHAAHAPLGWPEGAGRSIGIRR